jgi:anaerobic magnesium-protoporphyrin IX monomethyl ester cyclase
MNSLNEKTKTALVLLPVFWPQMPPLGLASLKAFAEKNGFPATAIDYNNRFFSKAADSLKKEWLISCNSRLEDSIVDILRSEHSEAFQEMLKEMIKYDVIGFSCFRSNYPATREIAGILKSGKPEIKIILGGPEMARQYFKYGNSFATENGFADLIAVGEGERPFLKFLLNGKTETRAALFEELDDLQGSSEPDNSDFNIESYPKKNAVSLLYSRGCVRKCAFCSERLLYKRFRVRPADAIVDQIKKYKRQGIEYFVFHDSLINGDLNALEDLCDRMINNFGSVKWEAQMAVRSDMSEELFRKIRQSGCYHVFIGLESGCDRTLRNMKKGYKAREAASFFRKLNDAGISFGVSIITGFPGETEEDFKESLDFIVNNRNLIPKIEQVNPFVYYEGTSLPEDADYRLHDESVKRADHFIERIKKEGFKYTKAFMMNLVEK